MHKPGTTGSASQRRKSEFIDRRQASRIIAAANHAAIIGRPLNTFVTVNFGHTDWTDADAIGERWTRSFLKEFNRWLRKTWPTSAPGAFVWGIEHPEHDHPHVHWSVHIPPIARRTFDKWVEARVRVVFGEFDHKAIDIQNRPRPRDQMNAAKYVAKGTKRAVHKHYRLSKEWERQGIITGKRCGHSESLGLAAISRYAMRAAA